MIRSSISTGLRAARPLLASAALLVAGCGSGSGTTVDQPKPGEAATVPVKVGKGRNMIPPADVDAIHPPKRISKP